MTTQFEDLLFVIVFEKAKSISDFQPCRPPVSFSSSLVLIGSL